MPRTLTWKLKCFKGRGVIAALPVRGTGDRVGIRTEPPNRLCRSSKGPTQTPSHLATLCRVLTKSGKQENSFPFEAHEYSITALAPAPAGGAALSAPDADTNVGAGTQERNRRIIE